MSDRVVVVGASGFGRECLDVLEAMREAGRDIDVVGVVDDGPDEFSQQLLQERDVPYLGPVSALRGMDSHALKYLLGIGSPQIRARLVKLVDEWGLAPFVAVHPSATFGSGSRVGAGAVVCAGVAVSSNVQFGEHVHLNPNATIGHDALLGDFVSVNPAAIVSGRVVLEQRVLLGTGSTVLQFLRVSEDSLVGAGAVVTKDVPPGVVVKGIPGRWNTVSKRGMDTVFSESPVL